MRSTFVNSEDFFEVVYLPAMAKDPRFDVLDGRITQLEQHRSANSGATRDVWVKRNSYWLWPVITLLIGSGVVGGFFRWFFGDLVDHQIDSKLSAPIAQLGDQKTTLARIDTRLNDISELLKIVVQNEMKRVAALAQEDFNKNLGTVKTVLSIAKTEQINSPTDTVADIKEKLQKANEKSPEFWNAAAALVNYASTKPVTPLKDCVTEPPAGRVTGLKPDPNNPNQTIVSYTTLTYSDCKIELDDPRAIKRYQEALPSFSLVLRHCVIVYRGRPIVVPLPPGVTKMVGKILFEDCIFDIVPTADLPEIGKTLVEALLNAADLKHAVFTFSNG
jgi:hypothetical protein